MPNEDRLPWVALMQFSFAELQLTPASFWQMTPREWMHALRGWKAANAPAETTIQRDELDEMTKTLSHIG